MNLVFTREAESGLEEIADFIARDSPRRAFTFVAELRDAAEQIALSPGAYPLVPRYETIGVRRRLHGNYVIFYRAESDRVTILLIVHGARDLGRLLNV